MVGMAREHGFANAAQAFPNFADATSVLSALLSLVHREPGFKQRRIILSGKAVLHFCYEQPQPALFAKAPGRSDFEVAAAHFGPGGVCAVFLLRGIEVSGITRPPPR